MKSIAFVVLGVLVQCQANTTYIVKLKEKPELRGLVDPMARVRSLLDEEEEELQYYSNIGSMYSVKMTEDKASSMSLQEDVEYVEKDFAVEAEMVQKRAAWHLSRISHRALLPPSKHEYQYNATGHGITVYIVDSGININHPEFEGRARHGKTFYGGSSRDGTGHGTFVAGLVGAKTFGVAKKANLVAVKVFDATGKSSGSSTIAAIDWVVRNAAPGKSILNLSLGAPKSKAFDDAVAAAVRNNIAVVAAAGNENVDACSRSPARSTNAITVGSIGPSDSRSKFSNYGSCVDILAPGERLPSTSNRGGVSLATGTSASAPVVAGILANYLSAAKLTPHQLKSKLLTASTTNLIKNLDVNTRNRLAYNSN